MSSSSRSCFRLFVYGTLRSTFQNPYARLLARSADLLGPGRVRGHLYRIKRYRGIRLEADARAWVEGERTAPGAGPERSQLISDPAAPGCVVRWVRGEIHRLHDLRILTALDRYEGPDYERVLVGVHRNNGSRLRCWIYQAKVDQAFSPATGT